MNREDVAYVQTEKAPISESECVYKPRLVLPSILGFFITTHIPLLFTLTRHYHLQQINRHYTQIKMKLTTTFSVLALATTALATPVEMVARTGGGSGGSPSTCNNDQKQVCCASLLGLTCLIDLLGGNCSGGTYCCSNGGSTVSFAKS